LTQQLGRIPVSGRANGLSAVRKNGLPELCETVPDWWKRFKNARLSEPREISLDQIVRSVAGYSNLYADWTPKTWDHAFERVYNSMRDEGYQPERDDDKYGSIRLFKVGDTFWVDNGFRRVASAKMLKLKTVRARVWEIEYQ
jgi:hypothetical protein